MELEELRKLTGYYFPKLCPNCGQYYEGYEDIWSINGDERCSHCVSKDDRTRLPIFVKYISDIHYGGTTIEAFTFKDANELYDIMKKHILNSSDILVKKNEQSAALVGQSSVFRYDGIYILGYIYNFDMDLLNIPISNYNVYNYDGRINIDKMNEWLKGKDVVKL